MLLIKVFKDENIFATFYSFFYFLICNACNTEYQSTIICLDNHGYRVGILCIDGCIEEKLKIPGGNCVVNC